MLWQKWNQAMQVWTLQGTSPTLSQGIRLLVVGSIVLALHACSGGGGSSPAVNTPTPTTTNPPASDPEAAFGLLMREALQAPAFAISPTANAEVELFNAFPSLNADGAVFLSSIPGTTDLAVVEQAGRVIRFDPANAGNSEVMLDISARRPMRANEEGLLGLAFDSQFASNGRAYVHYTDHEPRRSVLSRVLRLAGTGQLDPGSEQVLLEEGQPFSNHNGGMLAFGPDNMLYMALGDGGSANDPQNNSQRLSNLLGKLLRVDVSDTGLTIPNDNPFVTQAGARGEIWAYGLRNPWRFSFDRQTGDLWLGDVGQNSREEIDIITAGGNYGWRVFEANERFDDSANSLPDSAFTPPVFSYGRDSGFSVTGGYVYRGSAAPSLSGQYIYADFGGEVWALEYDGNQVNNNRSIGILNSVSSFGEDANGELFAVSLGGEIFGFRESGGSGELAAPELLSNTGLFAQLGTLTPVQGLIEYDVNTEFWSDGADKRRWIGIPDNQQLSFSNSEPWTFPVGTVVVKHFEIELQEGVPESAERLETRVLINTSNGFQGYVYRWNEQQTDAVLLTTSEQETLQITTSDGSRTQTWHYPSRAECLACHTTAAGEVLGVNTRQINRNFAYAAADDNQLRSWNNINLFDSSLSDFDQLDRMVDAQDPSADQELRARAYLDTNCGQCHRPGGAAGSALDFRYATSSNDLNAINTEPQSPGASPSDRLIIPGDREASVIWQRMNSVGADRMPPLASNRVDSEGAELIGAWIDSL
ncbi:MAG: PQQ-dependent sugar dehydrogenase [Pseudomonadales bacterium]